MNILMLGKPASGKGTLTKVLLEEGFIHLSTGDLLRAEAQKEGSPYAKEINQMFSSGTFASDELVVSLVLNFLKENEGKHIVFDGFPRNLHQVAVCEEKGITFDKVIYINAPDEIIKERIIHRRVHIPSGRSYHLINMPPKVEGLDDVTGEPLTQRLDDTPEIIEMRLKDFRQKTLPIAKHFEGKVLEVDGAAKLSDQIADVKAAVTFLRKKNSAKMMP